MNSRILCSSILTCALSAGLAHGGLFSRDKAMPKELSVRTTAYTHTESDHIQYGKKSAAGTKLQYGKKYSSAAADWSKFPLGTKFKIDGMDTTFVVDDYGSALVGTETIDIYKPSRSAMNNWGVRHVDIEILEYGDFDKSREILEGRTKYSHVREMLAGIKKDPGPEVQEKSKGFFKAKASEETPAPKQPITPPVPKADEPPVMQLAAATPPAPQPAPAPAPVQAYSAPAKAPTPTPTPSPKPKAAPASAPEPQPAVVPDVPAERKVRDFQPLQLANVSASETPEPSAAPSPAASSSTESSSTSEAKFRKREFRPLSLASING